MDAKIDTVDRRLSTKMDAGFARMDARIEATNEKMDAGFVRIDDRFDRHQRDFAAAKVWALGLYIGLAASLLLVLAKGFKWI